MVKSPIKWLESSIPPETQSVKSCQTLKKSITFAWWNPMKNHHYTQIPQDFCPSPRGLPRGLPRSDLLSQLFQKFFGRGPTHGLRRGHSDLGWWTGGRFSNKTWRSNKNARNHGDLNQKKIWKLHQHIYIVVSCSQAGWFIVPKMYFPLGLW